MSKITVQLVRSIISVSEKQKSTIKGLGLRKLNSTSVLTSTPEVNGMIKKVSHLVKVIDQS